MRLFAKHSGEGSLILAYSQTEDAVTCKELCSWVSPESCKSSRGLGSPSGVCPASWRKNDRFTCLSSLAIIMGNWKALVMTMEREIDLFLLIVAVWNVSGVLGTQIHTS